MTGEAGALRGAMIASLVVLFSGACAIAGADPAPEPPEGFEERPLDREETAEERRRREADQAVFDESGRIREQREQMTRQPGVTVDRLRRGQSPDYGVGPGVTIIRRQP